MALPEPRSTVQPSAPTRRRDPARKERILTAAAELAAQRGFHTIAMTDIGAHAGIVGSGIYRHFPTKEAILVALLDRIMERLRAGAADVVERGLDNRSTLTLLVRDHIKVATEDGAVLTVYYREAHTLPEDEQHRFRRAQRHYVEEWVHALTPLRRDLADGEVRLTVHAAIGAIQSTLSFHSGLADNRLTELLDTIAHACLGISPVEPPK